MPRRRALRITVIAVAALVVVIITAATVLVTVVVRRPFPQQHGEETLPGLSAAVSVLRDAHGVPDIYADNAEDLFRAQGYVQAQDRFFEMDWRRHVTAGRLSELVGTDADALQADEVVRTLGWRRVAQAELDAADATTRRYLDAYSQGVNDYLRGRSASELSLDYTLLGAQLNLPKIEPWTALDSITWFKAMAWDLRGNYTDELDRARTFGTVRDVDRVEQLWPPYPYARHAPIVTGSGGVSGTAGASATAGASPTSLAPLSRRPRVRPGTKPTAKPTTKPKTPQPKTAGKRPPADPTGMLAALLAAPAQRAFERTRLAVAAVPNLAGGGTDGVGSNSWVISGRFTATGKPLLANDPHLAASIPGIWYQMGLHCRTLSAACPFDVSGFTFAGVPGVVIGHTNRISWGMTNLGPDVTDFYLERLDGDSYLQDGQRKPLSSRKETILVTGGKAVTIVVRSTRHGPLLSDVLASVASVGQKAPVAKGSPARGDGYAVSLAWTALQPGRDIEAIFAIDSATDFASFRTAAELLDVPAQNLLYGDVDGHIGYQAPGRIPVRRPHATEPVPGDGTWPMPGWDSSYDWTGYLPAARLPWEEDPADGFIVAANQAVTSPQTGPYLSADFDYGDRAQRIRDLIQQAIDDRRPLRTSDLQAMQLDTRSGIAPDLVPLLLAAKVDSFTKDAQDLLRGWTDFTEPADSAPAAYFNAVWAALLDLTFADELPEGSRPNGGGRWQEVVRTLLKTPQDPWWDDRRTPNVVETRDEIIRRAMVAARLRLTQILGKDVHSWQWGRLHRLRLREVPLGDLGATLPLHPLLNRGPLEMPGGPSIVDALGWDAASGTFAVDWAPSMRMVVDLGDLDRSRWVNQTGESGHPGQANYADQLDAWANGETYDWPFTASAVKAAAEQNLQLRPPA